MAQVLVVGGGPLGLMNAIELALRARDNNTKMDIKVFERNNEYQRSHVLEVDHSSFKNLHPDLQAVLKPLLNPNANKSKIPTLVLEEALRTFAESIKLNNEPLIEIIRGKEVPSCALLKAEYPDAKVVIGADGSHSMVRKEILNTCDLYVKENFIPDRQSVANLLKDSAARKAKHTYVFSNSKLYYINRVENTMSREPLKLSDDKSGKLAELMQSIIASRQESPIWLSKRELEAIHKITGHELEDYDLSTNTQLQFLAEFKYQVPGVTRPLSIYPEEFLTTAYQNHLVFEAVGRPREEKVPVAVRALIDEQTYNRMSDVTFKAPLPLNDHDKMGLLLHKTFFARLAARMIMTGEKRVEPRITKTILSTYIAAKFAFDKDDMDWVVNGDSAMGVPFFRSYNSHSQIVAQCIEAVYNYATGLIDRKAFQKRYSSLLNYQSAKEWANAGVKNAFIDTSISAAEIIQSSNEKIETSSTSSTLKMSVSLSQENANFKEVMRAYNARVKLGNFPSLDSDSMENFISLVLSKGKEISLPILNEENKKLQEEILSNKGHLIKREEPKPSPLEEDEPKSTVSTASSGWSLLQFLGISKSSSSTTTSSNSSTTYQHRKLQ